VGEQRIVLKHQADAAFFRWQEYLFGGDFAAIDQHPAAIGRFNAGGDLQQCRLAAARAAQQRHYFARIDIEVDTVEAGIAAKIAGHAFHGQLGGKGRGGTNTRWLAGPCGGSGLVCGARHQIADIKQSFRYVRLMGIPEQMCNRGRNSS